MDITVIKTKTLGLAYSIANDAANDDKKIIEISPLGLGGILFIEGEFFSNDALEACYIENCDQRVWEAYLSLTYEAINSGLLIVESNFVGDLFSIANEALAKNIQIIDLRLLRGTNAHSYLFLTASEALTLKTFMLKMQEKQIKHTDKNSTLDQHQKEIHYQLITKVSNQVKDYFRISPSS